MSDKWVLVPVEPTAEMLEPMAREDCKHDGFDPDEPMPPHGHYPRWYDRCGPFAEIYRAMLAARPAAPAQEDEVERVAKARADYWAQRMDDAAALVAALTAERDALRWALRNMRTAAICFEAVAPEDDAIQDIREELVEAFVQSSALAASPAAPAQALEKDAHMDCYQYGTVPAAPAQDEIGWLIEFPHKASGPTYYGLADDGDGTVNLNSNADHSHAVRFARREDALMVAADIGWTSGEFLITEHMWVHKP